MGRLGLHRAVVSSQGPGGSRPLRNSERSQPHHLAATSCPRRRIKHGRLPSLFSSRSCTRRQYAGGRRTRRRSCYGRDRRTERRRFSSRCGRDRRAECSGLGSRCGRHRWTKRSGLSACRRTGRGFASGWWRLHRSHGRCGRPGRQRHQAERQQRVRSRRLAFGQGTWSLASSGSVRRGRHAGSSPSALDSSSSQGQHRLTQQQADHDHGESVPQFDPVLGRLDSG
jgi:hypothetical protein